MSGIIQFERVDHSRGVGGSASIRETCPPKPSHSRTCPPKPWRRRIRGKVSFRTKPDETPPSPLWGSLIHNNLRFISGRRRPVLISQIRPTEDLRGVRRTYEDQKNEKPRPSCCGPTPVPHMTLYGLVRPIMAMCGKELYRPGACRPFLSVLRVLCGSVVNFRSELHMRPLATYLHQVASTCTNLREKKMRESHRLVPSRASRSRLLRNQGLKR
jgi:hypothetical protein